MRFTKRPVSVDAFRLGVDPMPEWFCNARSANKVTTHNNDARCSGGPDYALIHTLEGTMRANYGDYVIQGVRGELYPCEPSIFADTYVAVADA